MSSFLGWHRTPVFSSFSKSYQYVPPQLAGWIHCEMDCRSQSLIRVFLSKVDLVSSPSSLFYSSFSFSSFSFPSHSPPFPSLPFWSLPFLCFFKLSQTSSFSPLTWCSGSPLVHEDRIKTYVTVSQDKYLLLQLPYYQVFCHSTGEIIDIDNIPRRCAGVY